mmetsp:Transcript_30850/g.99519  ORF Transcript_30850/g.99519 Transcript_30850/m.99519 type:complete len:210 (+) Transcript_30850:383-1012(+)
MCPSVQAAAAFTWSSGSLTSASFKGAMPCATITANPKVSEKAAMYPRAMIAGSFELPGASAMYSVNADAPPELTISFANSGVCFAISRMHEPALFCTNKSASFKQQSTLGKTSASTTASARSAECFATWAKHVQACRLSFTSGCRMNGARYETAPASTTACASSGECLQMSDRAEAEILFNEISGSCKHRTSEGTEPPSTTVCASSALC